MQKTRLSYDEEETFRKKLIALLLSGADNPIASKVNFQKRAVSSDQGDATV